MISPTKTKYLKPAIFALFLFFSCYLLLAPGLPVLAQGAGEQTQAESGDTAASRAIEMLDETAEEAKIISSPETAPTTFEIVGDIINIVLGVLGVIFLIIVIYGGIQWMTAGGNEETIKKATALLTQAVIGLAIVLFAYLFTNYVVFNIIEVVID